MWSCFCNYDSDKSNDDSKDKHRSSGKGDESYLDNSVESLVVPHSKETKVTKVTTDPNMVAENRMRTLPVRLSMKNSIIMTMQRIWLKGQGIEEKSLKSTVMSEFLLDQYCLLFSVVRTTAI